MRNIMVRDLKQTPIEQKRFEIVERKGLGHPDYICDAIMDRISVNLSKEYVNRFGAIMHHNVDKSLLVAGETELKFGGGKMRQPILLIFGDRATYEVEGVKIPVDEIAVDTAKEWFKNELRFVDPEEHVKYLVEIKPGSAELTDIFKRKSELLGANDTSAAVGYAPMSRTESIVLKTEGYINSLEFKKRFPESGEDVKIMSIRRNNELNLTIAMAMVDRYINDTKEYFEKKEEILSEIQNFLKKNSEFDSINVDLNTLDVKGRGLDGIYLTVLGTSADGADSGQVGRGNRVNGVIPLNRPVCSEAAAGKNPVSHIGKIYNLLSHHVANKICEEVEGAKEVYIWLVSQIGKPIDQPAIAAAQIITQPQVSFQSIKNQVEQVIDYELQNIDKFSDDLAKGKISIC